MTTHTSPTPSASPTNEALRGADLSMAAPTNLGDQSRVTTPCREVVALHREASNSSGVLSVAQQPQRQGSSTRHARIHPDVALSNRRSDTGSTSSDASARRRLSKRGRSEQSRRDLFTARHGEKRAQEIQEDVWNITAFLAKKIKQQRWVLHPAKNVVLGRWDTVASVALLYTATVTPFETAFIPAPIGWAECRNDPWFLANRALDIIFGVDMILQFFVAFQMGSTFGGYNWVTDHGTIIKHYLTTWFALDFVSSVRLTNIDFYSITFVA